MFTLAGKWLLSENQLISSNSYFNGSRVSDTFPFWDTFLASASLRVCSRVCKYPHLLFLCLKQHKCAGFSFFPFSETGLLECEVRASLSITRFFRVAILSSCDHQPLYVLSLFSSFLFSKPLFHNFKIYIFSI